MALSPVQGENEQVMVYKNAERKSYGCCFTGFKAGNFRKCKGKKCGNILL